LAAAASVAFARSGSASCASDPEFELLLACCGKKVGESDLSATLQSPLNWERVLQLANHHRVLPALFAFLQGRRDVPAGIQSVLRRQFQTYARQVLRLSAELTGILRKFESCGIEVLPHKGPALADNLFADPAMRQFGDLDFLIRATDVPRARIALQELGYRPNLQLSGRQKKAYLCAGYEYVFGSAAGKNLVEMQWQILPRFYSVAFDMDSLFSRAAVTEFEGERVRVLGKDDLMLVLCVHAAKHEWEQIGMIRDIATLASFDLDWDWIEQEARRLGILRILLISVWLARNLLGCELPQDFFSGPEMLICERLGRAFELKLTRSLETDPESLRYFRTMLKIRERWQDRARFAWRLAVTPNVGEWKTLAIPDPLFPLYRGVRAIRLLRRFCT
jgi:hypothetical protein